MVWLFAATAPEEGGEAKRQELAPIAIVNPLLAHGDILGLERHKKSSEEIEIEAMKKRKRRKREGKLFVCYFSPNIL